MSKAHLLTLLISSQGLFALGERAHATPRISGNVVNDVTEINPVEVDKVATPTSAGEVQKLITDWKGPVSIGGGHFSMGGQTASEHTLHLDMRKMDHVLAFDEQAKTAQVESGITWRKLQEYLDPKNLSVKIMQSYANFTVGGSLSVNVHGRYIGQGPLIMSVRSFHIVLADGTMKNASPTENPEIFYGAIGGYGGLGVITDATLDLADDVKVERTADRTSLKEYKENFFKNIRDDKKVIFHNGDIYPPYWDKVTSVTWRETDHDVTVKDRLMPVKAASSLDHFLLFAMTELPLGNQARVRVQEHMLKDKPVVWRNYEASYDVGSLEPASRKHSTYVLQEYFVPVNKLEDFAKEMGHIFNKHNANILNVSIRHAKKDPGSLLAWAREECFAFVIYYKQGTSDAARAKVGEWTRELIDAAVSVNGTYYLPYQLHATPEQFKKAYPNADKYFELKARLDPQYRFRNKLWDKYYKPKEKKLEKRPEEQTFLTLPEWYVVFSADELGAHLARGPPSSFPFYRSIFQFWGLEKDVLRATGGKYPFNFGYHVMIGVVGASYTAEYCLRGLYEKTFGRVAEFLGGTDSAEDHFLASLEADYGRFIHVTPWYEFPFAAKLAELWRTPPSGHFLRRWERRYYGTALLGAKSAWGWVIGKATGAAYAPEDLEIAVTPDTPDRQPLVLPRYEAFTGALSTLLASGVRVLDISGNQRIVLTMFAPAAWALSPTEGELVREWPVLTEPGVKRVAASVEVNRLHELLPAWDKAGLKLDHVFDY
jgi:FAD/FMN-containing dehydrogenase